MTDESTPASEARRGPLRRLYDWVLSWADSRFGTAGLAAISFAESSFFPIPPDVLQIALSVARPTRSFLYAAVSTVASVAGGILGWAIGQGLWQLAEPWFFGYVPGFSREKFEYVESLYRGNAFLAIFAAAFTPIPYKMFTIAAGVCGVPLGTLVAASTLGRGFSWSRRPRISSVPPPSSSSIATSKRSRWRCWSPSWLASPRSSCSCRAELVSRAGHVPPARAGGLS